VDVLIGLKIFLKFFRFGRFSPHQAQNLKSPHLFLFFNIRHAPLLQLISSLSELCLGALRVEFLLKTDSGYLRDAEVT